MHLSFILWPLLANIGELINIISNAATAEILKFRSNVT